MAEIYIALVDTPGIFATMIRVFLKQRYIHVVLALDERLEEAYSVGRRWPAIPILSGFEREDKKKILRKFPMARYAVYRLECTEMQKKRICAALYRDYGRRYSIHYAVLGLPFLVFGRPFYQKDHYTCSSYIARLLEKNEIVIAKKHFSLVTPKDFYQYEGKEMIFEGQLKEIVPLAGRYPRRRTEAVYE